MTAWARILLRYLVGAAFFGSTEIGRELAADPDLVEVVAVVIGLAVEGYYVIAKKRGWSL
ncbi:hypothetical protein [Oricola thermophila]|uniref:Uncharacterized protein n=1 Tax=Oricola thermophila TaxID=2742145 RepID=A0A6N1VFX3_9HYPH|nr:hypothetical protein [Oricola thermophila]QKV17867.1 hypothetical protein HTY61_05030 [Oricola thermophila]